ncbi:MAG: sigma-70 family RNA polymerase sigma factor [Bacteroidetes bacterium]|nr:sigma-70 family RNA polymerase sigma factor [Bacteroidota bacterium]MBS1974833.1 sigma-70 family RNA polymerase sigma factor [Bacteroidota bacterium]
MKQFEQLTETEIIERVLKGEKALYEIIVRRFNPYLYKIGRSYNYNHEDAQDLMQDTFVDAYKSLSQFEGRASFKTWISRIMLNNCYRKKEKSRSKNETMQEINENGTPMFHHYGNETGKIVQNRELGHIIEESLAKIPYDYRIVFSLREMNGMDVAETAGLLNISEANVKVRLNRAKAMLRGKIEESYSPGELFEFHATFCNAMADRVMTIINEL